MAVLPPAVILSVRWQAKLASRKVCPGFRKVSLKIQISTSCWLRKCSSSSFLPRNPSAFQQARSSSLPHSFLLGRTAIFGHEKKTVFKTTSGRAAPVGREEMDVRSRQVSSTHVWRVAIEEIRNFLAWVGGNLCGDHQVGCYGFGSRDYDTHSCFLHGLPSSRLSGCCGFGYELLRSGRLPGGGQHRLPGRLRGRLRKGFGLGFEGGVVVSFTIRPLGQSDSTPRPCLSVRQSARPAELSKR